MSITGFNRRRRELAALEETKKNEEVSIDLDTSETVENKIEYSNLKVDELKEIAKEKGIEGYEDMKKAELIELIEKA